MKKYLLILPFLFIPISALAVGTLTPNPSAEGTPIQFTGDWSYFLNVAGQILYPDNNPAECNQSFTNGGHLPNGGCNMDGFDQTSVQTFTNRNGYKIHIGDYKLIWNEPDDATSSAQLAFCRSDPSISACLAQSDIHFIEFSVGCDNKFTTGGLGCAIDKVSANTYGYTGVLINKFWPYMLSVIILIGILIFGKSVINKLFNK